ncbi:MAG: hydroxymethylbilane synthase, partial [Thermoanaerobaculia bacterium]
MSTPRPLRLGTRGSDLALWQSRHVAARIAALPGAPEVELVVIRTAGDNIADVPLSQVAGKAFFTREIEEALLSGEVDLAVHSLKDLATEMPSGLAIGAVLERQDPRDVLLAAAPVTLDTLPAGARVGTSSLRRKALLARARPDLVAVELRGNVPTRIRRLLEGRYDAIVLAAAGVNRLGLTAEVREHLDPERFLPAVAQGAMAVQLRSADSETTRWVASLDDGPTRASTAAERALLGRLEGGCQIPVGAFAEVAGGKLRLRAAVCALDGRRVVAGQRGVLARPAA